MTSAVSAFRVALRPIGAYRLSTTTGNVGSFDLRGAIESDFTAWQQGETSVVNDATVANTVVDDGAADRTEEMMTGYERKHCLWGAGNTTGMNNASEMPPVFIEKFLRGMSYKSSRFDEFKHQHNFKNFLSILNLSFVTFYAVNIVIEIEENFMASFVSLIAYCTTSEMTNDIKLLKKKKGYLNNSKAKTMPIEWSVESIF